MNKTALKNFAVWARRDLIKRISDRATLLGVYEDKPAKALEASTPTGFMVNGITFAYKKEVRDSFINKIKEIGYQDTIEEIAYTWFNRLVALRFMEVNGYLKNGANAENYYIIGSKTSGKLEPDAVTNAEKLLFVDKNIVYDFKDNNDNNGLYRYLLTSQCNHLNNDMPLMFEKIADYVELLLPDHLLDKDALIYKLVNDISEEDFNITKNDGNGNSSSQVEIVGWLYQFYISEKKEDVFAGLKNNTKISKSTLPAATQIFTPNWIVRYMTDNTLGKIWLESRESKLKSELEYYIEPAEQTEDVKQKLEEINKEYENKRVTDITFIDPCCGSGHILVYAFDVFYKMYLESGFVASDIPSKILEHNLIGIDVDKRAVQLTSFALTMKALSYDSNFLSKNIYPNVIDIKESNSLTVSEVEEFSKVAKLSKEDDEVVLHVVEKFKDAELYGSLIKDFNYSPERFDVVLKYLQNNVKEENEENFLNKLAISTVKPLLISLLKQAIALSSKYDAVVTNPPYATLSNLENEVIEYAKYNYELSKYDLYAMFIERCELFAKPNALFGMITMKTWMFLSSYYKLRVKFLEGNSFLQILDLGMRVFGDSVGTIVQASSFIALKQSINEIKTKTFDLQAGMSSSEKEQSFVNRDCDTYVSDLNKFSAIDGFPFSYWVKSSMIDIFIKEKKIIDYVIPKQGMATSDNNRFLRQWSEVSILNSKFNTLSHEDSINSGKKWFAYNKGGVFRKWFGNNSYVVNWYNDGIEMEKFTSKLPQGTSVRLKSREYYFEQSVSWPFITSIDKFGVRYIPNGFIFDVAGSSIFGNKETIYYIMALLNTKINIEFIKILNPTMNVQVKDIKSIPLIINHKSKDVVNSIVKNNINLSKSDWDQFEISWDFKQNPLNPAEYGLQEEKPNNNYNISDLYKMYKQTVNARFNQLKNNEEELNKIFIEIYGLQDELDPYVENKDITVAHVFDSKSDIPEDFKGNSYVLTKEDVVKDLISYIVGCAFGRYSPYKEGLIFAGGEFDFSSYINIIREHKGLSLSDIAKVNVSVLPAEENFLLMTDKEYSQNHSNRVYDLTSYIVEFVEKMYGTTTLNENLRFIANALDSSNKFTPSEVIRRYLFNDFYKDHVKKYKKRPIYWQFDAGRNGGFRGLMYLHRYDATTIPTIRLSYLHELQWKYEQEKERLEKLVADTEVASEKAKASREISKLEKQLLECKSYDELLNHASNMQIKLDLDDGVKVNYQKLQSLDGDKNKNLLSTHLKF